MDEQLNEMIPEEQDYQLEDVTENPEQELTAEEKRNKEFPKEIQDAFFKLRDICDLEDAAVREVQLRKWTRLEYYFNNLIGIFWDAQIGTWRIPDWDQLSEEDNEMPPRIIAIYRAHAEAIIAALSVSTPGIVFFPDDSEDPLDIETAESCSDIAELIQRHIDAPVVFMKALTILFNQGTIFAYNYYRKDKKFGEILKPNIETVEVPLYLQSCSNCGYDLGQSYEPITSQMTCSQCNQMTIPENEIGSEQMEIQTGIKRLEKGRVLVDLYDPRFVKVSFYARSQEHIGYLHLTFDQNVALLRTVFEDPSIQARNTDSTYNNWARYATNYLGALPDNTAIVKCCWYRPWQYAALGGDYAQTIQELNKRFPDGCYVIFINDVFMDAVNENLDDHWTISDNPLSQYIHNEPLGTNLATIQDIRAEVDDLKLQTVEHSISETFADPAVLDFDEFRKVASSPGSITPTKGAAPGKSIADGFYQTKVATLSPEIFEYEKGLDADAQFVTGSFPSVYGGPSEGGGKTAAEYRMSRAQALQRLGITWRIVSKFWCNVIKNCTTEFISNMAEEEHFSVKNGKKYNNITISPKKLRGNIGHVEPEFSDQLPVTWEQMNSTVMSLMQLKDPTIESVLFHPENSELMKKVVGLQNIYIPGEEDRNKQYAEFLALSMSQPIPGPNGQMMPSVMPDESDNHMVQAEVLKAILVSQKGQNLKQNNPAAYQNCILHMNMHLMMAQPEQPVKEEPKPKENQE